MASAAVVTPGRAPERVGSGIVRHGRLRRRSAGRAADDAGGGETARGHRSRCSAIDGCPALLSGGSGPRCPGSGPVCHYFGVIAPPAAGAGARASGFRSLPVKCGDARCTTFCNGRELQAEYRRIPLPPQPAGQSPPALAWHLCTAGDKRTRGSEERGHLVRLAEELAPANIPRRLILKDPDRPARRPNRSLRSASNHQTPSPFCRSTSPKATRPRPRVSTTPTTASNAPTGSFLSSPGPWPPSSRLPRA